jgi:hypothetical protein
LLAVLIACLFEGAWGNGIRLAARSPAACEPTHTQFLRPSATGRIAGQAVTLIAKLYEVAPHVALALQIGADLLA